MSELLCSIDVESPEREREREKVHRGNNFVIIKNNACYNNYSPVYFTEHVQFFSST
jgi:hypothetical protein